MSNLFTLVTPSRNLKAVQDNMSKWGAAMADSHFDGLPLMDKTKSIAARYNEALSIIKTPYIIFCHDDAYPLQVPGYNIGQTLAKHMENTDWLGFVGSNKLVGPVWCSAGLGRCFGSISTECPTLMKTLIWGMTARRVQGMKTTDGMCFVCRTDMAQEIGFDEQFGYHYYDIDTFASAQAAGHRTAVACDVAIVHQSPGKFDHEWGMAGALLAKKWAGKCDLHDPSVGGAFNVIESPHPTALLLRLQEIWSYLPEEVSVV